MDQKFYVYLYRDPENNEVVYVGSGTGRRAWFHLGYQGNSPLEVLIQKRRAAGIVMEPEIKRYFDDRKTAFIYEAELILKYGLKEHDGTLLNKAWGQRTFSPDVKVHPYVDRRTFRKRKGWSITERK